MAKFVFKLDPLLEHRRRAERDHQVRVAAIETERRRLEDQLRRLNDRTQSSRHALRSSLAPSGSGGVVDTTAARWQAGATMSMDARARVLAVQLAGVLKRVEEARDLLREAARERRAVERLRERRYEAWKAAAAAAEARDLDEINTVRSARRTDEGAAA